MRRIYLYFLCLTTLTPSLAPAACPQDKPADKPQLMGIILVPPTAGFRAEFLEEITYYEKRYTSLAESMPAEKYTWRPGEGVRSVGEVFAHIAIANYRAGEALAGLPKPGVYSSFHPKTIEAISADKPRLLQALKNSFASLRNEVLQLNDADADRAQKIFNHETTLRGSFIAITGHFGEHLGQSIAYARVNGVVPPWTEGFNQPQQKPAEKPKP